MYPTNVFVPDTAECLSRTALSSNIYKKEDLIKRPRRNRKSHAIRALIQETHLNPSQLIAPLFLLEGTHIEQPIKSMPGIFRKSIDLILKEIEDLTQLDIGVINLFAVVDQARKDAWGSEAIRPRNVIHQAIGTIKKAFPHLCIMVDIALDPYTDHGHDGLVNEKGEILNDETLAQLAKMALMAADAGADVIAPGDMMDGRVAYLRHALDSKGFYQVGILSYTAKYASSFYGPFRDALQSNLKFGDKKTYQMNPANSREALIEAALDEAEGADFLLVKPALAYLDIIAKIRERTSLPLGAYHVSGEYAMAMAAAEKGFLDADKVFLEMLTAIKRAGADFILSYAAARVARLLKN